MSIARHHAEWQSLVEVSGPFLSVAVLEKVFPQGLDDVDSELRERLRMAHEEWLDAVSGRLDVAIHNAWVRIVFRDGLGFDERDILQDSPLLRLALPEHHDTLAATFAIKNPDGRDDAGRPRLLVSVLHPKQNPDKPLPDSLLKAPPVDRMLLLLRGLQAQGASFRLGLVTNGSEWVLLHVAPNETTTYVRWTSELWFDEPLTLRAFTALISARRLFGVHTMFPSSIGLSFCVHAGARLRVHARWGHYAHVHSATRMSDAGSPVKVWKRAERRISRRRVVRFAVSSTR